MSTVWVIWRLDREMRKLYGETSSQGCCGGI